MPRRINASRRLDAARGVDAATRNLWLMIALTFVTGVVDAGGYLGLDKVFVGNMTGNVIVLGMGAAGAGGLPVLGPAIALGTFVVGAGIAGVILRGKPAGWSPWLTLVCTASAVLVTIAAVLCVVADTNSAVQVAAAAVTACAMGMQAAAARKVGVADVTTVVVTSTLTVWATDLFAAPSRTTLLNRRLAAIISILLGALVGALLLQLALWVPFAVAAAIAAGVVAIGHRAHLS